MIFRPFVEVVLKVTVIPSKYVYSMSLMRDFFISAFHQINTKMLALEGWHLYDIEQINFPEKYPDFCGNDSITYVPNCKSFGSPTLKDQYIL